MPFEVYIERNAARDKLEVYIFERQKNGSRAVFLPITPTLKIFDEQEKIEPTLSFRQSVSDEFFEAAADALIQSGKLPKPISAGYIEGELKATKIHLEDLQSILILKKILGEQHAKD